jgi:hypothetical protein
MGNTATETFQLIKQAYADNALSCALVFEWYARFWDSHQNFKDDGQSGQPTAVRTPDMIKTVHELISTDRRMTLRMMEEEILSRLVQRISRVRPQFQERGSWFLLHDVRPHNAVSIKQFLAKQGIPELNRLHNLLIYPHQTFSYSPKSNPH